jgi:regulator of replication initiation timing
MNSDEIDTLRAENERFRDENDRLARRNVLLVLEIEQLRDRLAEYLERLR